MPIFIPENDDLREDLERRQREARRANYYGIVFCIAATLTATYAMINL